MAIVFRSENSLFLSHKELIDSHYRGMYEMKKEFFEINRPFAQNSDSVSVKRKRRKLDKEDREEKSTELEVKLRGFVEKCREAGHLGRVDATANEEAIEEASRVHNLAISHPVLHGENRNLQCITTTIDGQEFLIPPECHFYQNDVRKIETFLLPGNEVFDLIVIDPPWWNKYIRRVKKANKNISYDMLYNDDIADLPVRGLTSSRSIVAIWCTNNKSHLEDILNKFIPRWGLKHLTQWLWMKVTKEGEPICAFADEEKKQPYERIIVAMKDSQENAPLADKIPRDVSVVSIPSSIHSHKPPLMDIFKPYLPQNPKCLELFARYLNPGFTSVGLEVLKLQHM
ncbi:N(6)-adenine-specific methyltransferase METTL4 isoform X2 [Phlebotomus papatasi]|uniref:N(6)-adenine-specific methyltransferase METTL4 isoform X2 n=1 Tax=Phlebotomus papatasi TaxID=29031 RepID=UPI002483E931|nr:N(6)-adenine-specific methyltransferase METTL4 isoform X2 [Phlebotomus papatasi]